jgi:uncharacterized membrane protein
MTRKRDSLIIIFFIMTTCIQVTNTVFADQRDFSIYTPFPTIEFKSGQKIIYDVFIKNNGQQEEIMDLEVYGPKYWDIVVKSGLYQIKSIYLSVNETKKISVEVLSLNEQTSGNHTISVSVITLDSILSETVDLNVELPVEVEASGLSLIASYPSLEGSIGEDYEFRVNTINKANKDVVIYFSAVHPENWDVSFKPRFSSSIVRSLEFAAGANDVVIVDVSPPLTVEPGQYHITINAETDDHQESITFTVYITGSYSLDFQPSNSRLSLEAIQGQSNIISVNVSNAGSAFLENIVLFSDKPPGWDVDIEFDEIDSLERGTSRQIRVNIVPPLDAIPGDYAVSLFSAIQERGISNNLNYRVTVTGAVGWGFLGIGIIGLLAIVLGVIVYRLGRR